MLYLCRTIEEAKWEQEEKVSWEEGRKKKEEEGLKRPFWVLNPIAMTLPTLPSLFIQEAVLVGVAGGNPVNRVGLQGPFPFILGMGFLLSLIVKQSKSRVTP